MAFLCDIPWKRCVRRHWRFCQKASNKNQSSEARRRSNIKPFPALRVGERKCPFNNFFYLSVKEYLEEQKTLEKRFCQAKSIAGTQKFHGFIPLNKNEIKTKFFSNSNDFSIHKISGKEGQV